MENFKWQHIQFENGSNPYICKTEMEFERMKNKYNLEPLTEGCWLVKQFERISGWLEIVYREITDEMKEYTSEEDWYQAGFEYEGGFHWLSDFIRCHNNSWSGIDAPNYIHGYDSTNIYNPLFVEINDSGEAVRLYEYVK